MLVVTSGAVAFTLSTLTDSSLARPAVMVFGAIWTWDVLHVYRKSVTNFVVKYSTAQCHTHDVYHGMSSDCVLLKFSI